MYIIKCMNILLTYINIFLIISRFRICKSCSCETIGCCFMTRYILLTFFAILKKKHNMMQQMTKTCLVDWLESYKLFFIHIILSHVINNYGIYFCAIWKFICTWKFIMNFLMQINFHIALKPCRNCIILSCNRVYYAGL